MRQGTKRVIALFVNGLSYMNEYCWITKMMRRICPAARFASVLLPAVVIAGEACADGGVFVRFTMTAPQGGKYFVRLGGFIHREPWYLPAAVVPAGAAKVPEARIPAGQSTDWFDLKAYAGGLLHGRLDRAGGVAEFPNVTAEFVADLADPNRSVVIELATAPDERSVVRRFEETFNGTATSFLVSPNLVTDKDGLETATQMTERRLKWAREASGGTRVSPKQLIVQTGFWGPQRPELNLKEAEVLWLLGFNVVGGQMPEVRAKFPDLIVPGHTHRVLFGPESTREQVDECMRAQAAGKNGAVSPGTPFGFSDEICARPGIANNPKALEFFRAWLAERKIPAADLGVTNLADVVPIDEPAAFREREKSNGPAARRVFYYTSRFRQVAGTRRIAWTSESFHKYYPEGYVTTALVADHPYFGGTGLGMGMVPNTAWGGAPLALDWFDLARNKAVDCIGIEDWMGLQYMYGPKYTWEGFQLMGFQASMFRSGSRGKLPIISWITPSDETNLRLKSASALAQGARHFFYWTYGPTATSTENYWSDLRGEYDGIVKITRQLAMAEHVLAPGKMRPTRVALLYSISSDLWQPFGYVHMLERRATYLSLVHEQYLVDMLTEEDVEEGRLKDYDVLYATDPCISTAAAKDIREWVRKGGRICGSCAAGSLSEFNEPSSVLAEVFGIKPGVKAETQPGEYRIRGMLNGIPFSDWIMMSGGGKPGVSGVGFGVVGTRVSFTPSAGRVTGKFRDGSAAVVVNTFGKGIATYVGACPGLSYIKDAKFVPGELKEEWPPEQRSFINAVAHDAAAARPVGLSHPVVEAGVYDSPQGTALVLANFTYRPIANLRVDLPVRGRIVRVRSAEQGEIKFSIRPVDEVAFGKGYASAVSFVLPLGINDIIVVE